MMAAALDAQPQHPHQPLPPPPQQQQQPFNRLTSCDRHPDQQVTGFCASCLRERLAGLDTANRRLNASSSGASAALKSLFFRPAGRNADPAGAGGSSRSSFLPELRRCKSFSGGRGAPSASAMEPQRKSCDVRVRNTLWSLFHLDDGGPAGGGGDPSSLCPAPISPAAANAGAGGEIEVEVEARSLRFDPSVADPVIESPEEEDEDAEEKSGDVEVEAAPAPVAAEEFGEDDGEIRMEPIVLPEEAKQEEMGGEEEPRTMKDHIDLNAQSKKPPPKDLKEIAGSFWLAASVFSKKLQKWRRKQKLKKQEAAAAAAAGVGKASAAAIRAEKPSSRSRRFFRDTQSELAEEALGRRSCDTDPRFSLDAGRMSFDDPRFSWDEPRASWDGYLTGGRSVFPRMPPMLAVMEDAPAAATAPSVQRLDGQIPVEEDSTIPGGSVQTRDYYLDCSQRRRRSLDRSSSVRRPSFEADELPRTSNAKASPTAMATEYFNFLNKFERDCRDSNPSSLRDDYSESFDSAFRDPHKEGGGGGGGNPKKSRRWSKAWSLWGLIHRRSRSRGVGANGVERSFSETWPELQRDGYNGKVFRCNSSVSSRHCSNGNGNAGLGSMRRNGLEINGHGKKRTGEFVLERNRSARYSPSHLDNGLLRFYLTPMRSSRRSGGGGSGKGRHLHSHSFTRSMLQLY